jgi:16S rRNA (adenine1518-N6/adenine1519-N6)-dimethyltransferase
MQRLGQHFLKNEDVIEAIINRLDIQPNETIIEIGPGGGALTLPLLKICKEKNSSLIAIEKDEALATLLQIETDKIGGQMRIVKADALTQLPKLTNQLTNQPTNYKLIGNIPYYITGSLLRLIGELAKKPIISILMVQEEVADRVGATVPKMNLLAAATQIWSDIEVFIRVDRKEFSPPPEVDSAVIELKTINRGLSDANLEKYYKTIKSVFKQPRKTLLNNIEEAVGTEKEQIVKILTKNDFEPGSRGQNLSIDDLIRLSKILNLPD